jgi:hypothetical protein
MDSLPRKNQGSDVIIEFEVEDFDNEGIFFTDSNGLDMVKRRLK